MAAKALKSLFRGAGRNALDLPVAGLAALAAAFTAFVVPQDILSRAVVATGLPSLVSAAQPPLGLTARLALAVGGAAIVFGLVFLLLRLFDKSGMGAAEAAADLSVAPRVRRRDGHPDAPAPRPISAARDLGEPAPPRAPRAPVPLWLDEAEPAGGSPDAPATALVEAPMSEPEPEPQAELIAPVAALWPEAVAEPEAEPEHVLEPQAVAEPEPELEPDPVSATEPVAAPQAEMPTSIAGLMARLEQGLARRRMIEIAPAEPPQVFPEASPTAVPDAPLPADPAEDRLQSAIASLQRLAARSS